LKVMVIDGPNLNLLGSREPAIYGGTSLGEIRASLGEVARELMVDLEFFQSNGEGELIDAIHRAGEVADGIVINPGAYGHYSIAMRDALAAVGVPAVEVHISNVYAREEFRSRSVIAPVCIGGVWGFGSDVYEWGLRALIKKLRDNG